MPTYWNAYFYVIAIDLYNNDVQISNNGIISRRI